MARTAGHRGSSGFSCRYSLLVLLDKTFKDRIKGNAVALALVARMVPNIRLALLVAAPVVHVAQLVAHLAPPFQATIARCASSIAE